MIANGRAIIHAMFIPMRPQVAILNRVVTNILWYRRRTLILVIPKAGHDSVWSA